MKNVSFAATRRSLVDRLVNWDDQKRWQEFFDTYWKLIYGVAIKSGLTHPEAQDVVQETVISVSKSMHNFKADPAYGSFKAWLLNLTRWRITDQFRKRRPAVNTREKPPTSGSESSESDATPTAVAELVPDPSGNALETIWNDEWDKHIVDAALDLQFIRDVIFNAAAPSAGRRIIPRAVLRFRLGMPAERIASEIADVGQCRKVIAHRIETDLQGQFLL